MHGSHPWQFCSLFISSFRVQLIIVDKAHHAPTSSYTNILSRQEGPLGQQDGWASYTNILSRPVTVASGPLGPAGPGELGQSQLGQLPLRQLPLGQRQRGVVHSGTPCPAAWF